MPPTAQSPWSSGSLPSAHARNRPPLQAHRQTTGEPAAPRSAGERARMEPTAAGLAKGRLRRVARRPPQEPRVGHGRREWRPGPQRPSGHYDATPAVSAHRQLRPIGRQSERPAPFPGTCKARRCALVAPHHRGRPATHYALTLPTRPSGSAEVTWALATGATSAAPTRLAASDHEADGVTRKHLWHLPARRAPGWTAHLVRTGRSPTSPMKSPVLGAA